MRLVALRDDRLYDQHLPVVRHIRANVLEYRLVRVVVPVMNYVLEEVDVRLDRNLLEEVALYQFDAIGNTVRLEHPWRVSDHLWKVEQNTLCIWINSQYG